MYHQVKELQQDVEDRGTSLQQVAADPVFMPQQQVL